MAVRPGIADALVQQPSVQLVVALHPHPWAEEPLAHQPDLVFNLAFFPTRSRGACHRIDQVVAAHLQEPAIIRPLSADKDRIDRGLHVVVDPARAGALEEPEPAVVRVEHHLLRLTRIGPHEQHAAVAQAQMRNLHRDGRAVDQHDLMAPVELVGLAGREAQRHIGIRQRRDLLAPPVTGITTHRVVAAFVTEPSQCLEHSDQRQTLAARLGLIGSEQSVQLLSPCSETRHRLLLALVAELRCCRT